MWSWNDPGKPKRSQVKGDKTVDQDQKRERCQSDITGTCTGVADGVFMTDLGQARQFGQTMTWLAKLAASAPRP